MVTGAVAEMPGTPLPTDRCIYLRPALYPSSAQGAWRAASHAAPSRTRRDNVSQALLEVGDHVEVQGKNEPSIW
jgi:hypothetical protein